MKNSPLLLLLLLAPLAQAAETTPAARVVDPQAVTMGSLRVTKGETTYELPLVDTEVEAGVAGLVADVLVTQTFANPFDEPIEAVYLFPLPDEAAVDDFVMTVGDRRIVGEIHEKEEARQIYEEARDNGQAAALLDQQRPNMFTQRVANIPPGESIAVTLGFVEVLEYDDGGYEWAFPLVVGPRYIPPEGTGKGAQDAADIDVPISRGRTGNTVSITVDIDAGMPIQAVRSPSHDIDVSLLAEGAVVELAPYDDIPNKDFILRYDLAGERPEAAVVTHAGELGGYALIMLQPQADEHIVAEEISARDLVFVVDTSCSQSGAPMEAAKDAMHLAIDGMHEDDRFTVLRFSNGTSQLSSELLPNTPDAVRRGHQFVSSFSGSGGTNMLAGVQQALSIPEEPGRLRTVLMMTDGYIGNETAIIDTVQNELGSARFFTLGTGSSTNRYLIDRIARAGRGDAVFLRPDEDPEPIVQAFHERFATPLITGLEVETEGIELFELQPDPLPDLFAGQPVILLAKFDEPGSGVVRLRGEVRGRPWSQEVQVELPEAQPENAGLASIWARKQIADWTMRQGFDAAFDGRAEYEEAVTQLALKHRLMSEFTSFVAVEERVINEGGRLKTVKVPVETPEFVEFDAVAEDEESYYAPTSAPTAAYRSSVGSSSGVVGGLGGLGTRGSGFGGGGYGRGAAAEARKAKPARMAEVALEPAPLAEPEESAGESLPRSPVVLGSLDSSAIAAVIKRSAVPHITRAYEQALKSNPSLAGRVSVVMTVAADGRVTAVTFDEDTVGDGTLAEAIRRTLMRLRFEGTGSESTIKYPFVFQAN